MLLSPVFYHDTDSLVISVLFDPKLHNFDCLVGLKHILDTSGFPHDHILYEYKTPMQKMGLLKIEGFPQILHKAYFLKSKLYTLLYLGECGRESVEKKCKGASAQSIKDLTMNDYLSCIDENRMLRADQRSIRSFNSQLYTIVSNKQVLQGIDYKNYFFNERECTQYGDPQIAVAKRTLGFKRAAPLPIDCPVLPAKRARCESSSSSSSSSIRKRRLSTSCTIKEVDDSAAAAADCSSPEKRIRLCDYSSSSDSSDESA
jgi:hypothetical protein